ncbi:uncharacterized protein LOC122446780 [Cervus canadensis]|uniref:uncharacterized protein LOC122446780 n=1 Tax=Cervus canadensis TaxID=1574408 RepID=UPI001C9E53FB|nr:uncharacterized protein LOC122446780 [Cervus canadensis]
MGFHASACHGKPIFKIKTKNVNENKTDPEWPHERIPGALLYHSGAGIPTPRCSMVRCGVWRRCFPSQEPRAPGGAGPAPSSAPPLGVSRLRPPAARLRRGAGRAARGGQAPCRASTARLAPLPAAGPQNRPQGALPRWPPRVAASRRVPYLLMTPFTQLCKSQNGDGDIVGFFFFPQTCFVLRAVTSNHPFTNFLVCKQLE